MNIISIDPGVTSGVVIAYFTPRVDSLSVHLVWQGTDTNPGMIYSRMKTNRCRTVVMEQKPTHPSQEGLDTWEALYQRFLVDGANISHDLALERRNPKKPVVYFVQPSQWKPFMKSRSKDVPVIEHHAADPARMLHYFLQVNFMDKEIYYV